MGKDELRFFSWQCDKCGRKVIVQSGGLPLGWVERTECRPYGKGPITEDVAEEVSVSEVFCCVEHELAWLQESVSFERRLTS